MSFSNNVKDRERDKFRQTPDDNTTVAVVETYEGDGTVGGTPIQHNFDLTVAVAKNVTVNHDIIINDGQVAELHQINLNASGLSEFELLIGDGAATEAFTTKELVDTAEINVHVIPYTKPIIVAGTVDGLTIRIAKTNLANQAQDLASKMILVIR